VTTGVVGSADERGVRAETGGYDGCIDQQVHRARLHAAPQRAPPDLAGLGDSPGDDDEVGIEDVEQVADRSTAGEGTVGDDGGRRPPAVVGGGEHGSVGVDSLRVAVVGAVNAGARGEHFEVAGLAAGAVDPGGLGNGDVADVSGRGAGTGEALAAGDDRPADP